MNFNRRLSEKDWLHIAQIGQIETKQQKKTEFILEKCIW